MGLKIVELVVVVDVFEVVILVVSPSVRLVLRFFGREEIAEIVVILVVVDQVFLCRTSKLSQRMLINRDQVGSMNRGRQTADQDAGLPAGFDTELVQVNCGVPVLERVFSDLF